MQGIKINSGSFATDWRETLRKKSITLQTEKCYCLECGGLLGDMEPKEILFQFIIPVKSYTSALTSASRWNELQPKPVPNSCCSWARHTACGHWLTAPACQNAHRIVSLIDRRKEGEGQPMELCWTGSKRGAASFLVLSPLPLSMDAAAMSTASLGFVQGPYLHLVTSLWICSILSPM